MGSQLVMNGLPSGKYILAVSSNETGTTYTISLTCDAFVPFTCGDTIEGHEADYFKPNWYNIRITADEYVMFDSCDSDSGVYILVLSIWYSFV